MLDMKLFRDNPEIIRRDHERRGISQEPINEVIRLDNEWKNSLHTPCRNTVKYFSTKKGIFYVMSVLML